MQENKSRAQTRVCKYCKTEIPAGAKICPNCKKRQRPGGCLIVAVVAVVLVLLAAALGGQSKPQAVSTGAASAGTADPQIQNDTSTDQTVFGVGETAELNGVQVTLQAMEENPGNDYIQPADGNVFVMVQFEIKNSSEEDLSVSSMVSFEAYCDDYSLNESLTGETLYPDGGSLNGNVAAGKNINGILVYEVPADWQKLEVSFSPSVWNDQTIPFLVMNS